MHHIYWKLTVFVIGIILVIMEFSIARKRKIDEFESGLFIEEGMLVVTGIIFMIGAAGWFLIGGIMGF